MENGGSPSMCILLANSTFVRLFYLFQVQIMVDITRWNGKVACFRGMFSLFDFAISILKDGDSNKGTR